MGKKHRRKRHRNKFEKDLYAAHVAISTRSRSSTDARIIYHYTDPKGLIGIVSEGQLWATDIRYLNDSSELQHAQKLQQQVLADLAEVPDAMEGARRLAEASKDASRPFRQIFVVCFCEEDDLLTQWKTYGAWGSGFSLGLDRERLEKVLPKFGAAPSKVDLERVEYSEEEQRGYLKRAFDVYNSLLPAAKRGSPYHISRCADAIASNASESASRFKHPAFESEKEWRIVISSEEPFPGSSPELHFRSSSRTVIPYVITPKQPDGKLPIVSITIGPTLDQNLSTQSVKALLMAKGYYDDENDCPTIKSSVVPLTRTD